MWATSIHRSAVGTRKAIGSIVGTAFFVLILLSGYYFYTLMNQEDAWQQRVFSDMRNFDIERSQETLTQSGAINVEDTSLKVNIKNTSSRPLNIVKIGVKLSDSTWEYNPEVIVDTDETLPTWVNVGKEYTFTISISGVDLSHGTYLIQFITERGNLFPITVSYP